MNTTQWIAQASTSIKAPLKQVWAAMTSKEGIKKFFWNVDVETNWKVGAPIVWKGEWEGKTFEDRGVIRRFEPMSVFEYTYWTSFSGTEYSEETSQLVTNEFSEQKEGVVVTIRQTGIATEEAKTHSESNWQTLLNSIKAALESERD